MAKLVAKFQLLYPLVNIDLQLNDRKVDIVDEGFDIAIRIGQLKSSSLIAKHIAPIRVILCASPEYLKQYGTPTHPEDLKTHRYLHYSYMEIDANNEVFKWLKAQNSGQSSELRSNNGDVLVEAAIAGAGIVLQPTFIASKALQSGELIQILPEFEPESIGLYAVYAHRKLLPNKVRCFIDFMEGYYGTPPYWDQTISQ